MDKKILKKFFDIKYNAKLRKRLTNHDFTILCSNCMGGIISHRLGERFNSPTINLWMSEPDFQKFCLDLSYYQSCKLHFFESATRYPTAKLGEKNKEIVIYFLHYNSKKEAERKWYERLQRVNDKNLYIIATDNDGMSKIQIEQWGKMKCNNMVIFSSKEYPELPYVFLLKKYKGNVNVGKYVNDVNKITGLCYAEKMFDFVEFLNKK